MLIQLYAELSRSKAAPQGICVANSAGKVLAWTLSFDDDASIGTFLDYAHQRYKDSPDAARAVTAERFMKFPSRKMPDVADTGRKLTIPDRHEKSDRCPALPALERGTLVGRIIGRPLDEKGRPIQQTVRQEDYMEARFEVPVGQQQRFVRALAEAPAGESFAVPSELARLLVSHAYLGQLDVNPLGGRQTGGKTDRESIEFHATLVLGEGDGQSVYITGTSNVAGGPAEIGIRTDGRQWEHNVQLAWEGYIEIVGDRITRLVLTAQGTERLRWGSQLWNLTAEPDVAHLMAGHPIDFDGPVRYGLIAEPCGEDEIASSDTPQAILPRGSDVPASMGQRLAHLREAVKHLRAAGANQLADQIAQQIKRMEQGLSRGSNEPEK